MAISLNRPQFANRLYMGSVYFYLSGGALMKRPARTCPELLIP